MSGEELVPKLFIFLILFILLHIKQALAYAWIIKSGHKMHKSSSITEPFQTLRFTHEEQEILVLSKLHMNELKSEFGIKDGTAIYIDNYQYTKVIGLHSDEGSTYINTNSKHSKIGVGYAILDKYPHALSARSFLYFSQGDVIDSGFNSLGVGMAYGITFPYFPGKFGYTEYSIYRKQCLKRQSSETRIDAKLGLKFSKTKELALGGYAIFYDNKIGMISQSHKNITIPKIARDTITKGYLKFAMDWSKKEILESDLVLNFQDHSTSILLSYIVKV